MGLDALTVLTLPSPLGGGGVAAVPATDVDVTIEDTPFWLAIDKQRSLSYQRQTAQFQRQQVDQQPEAGEQSLSAWWLRSQMSFHMGAGQRFLDTSAKTDEVDRARFRDCRGVNVWTPGAVSRLNGTTLAHATSGTAKHWVMTTVVNGAEALVSAHGTTVEVFNGTSWTTMGAGTTTTILGFCIDGVNYYALTASGIYKGPIDGSTGAGMIYAVTGAPTRGALGWCKERLMAAIGPSVYALDCNATTGSALPTFLQQHPNPAWTWVGFTDTPSGIAFAGYAGLQSAAFEAKLTSSSSGSGAPVLSAGFPILSLPSGEIVQDLLLYLGSTLILATNRGVRVSTFQSYYGTITLGPLVQLEGDGVQMSCTALSAYDRFVYAGTQLDGFPALLRIDLGNVEDQAGHYPWAPDLLCPAGGTAPAGGAVTGIAHRIDGRKWFVVPNYGIVAESTAPDLAQPAWIQTSRIRVGSVEDKNWAHGVVRGDGLSASAGIAVEAMTPSQAWTPQYTALSNGDRFGFTVPKGEWIALRLTLLGAATVLNSYQVQALPAGRRQRIIQIPLSVVDYQVTRSGVTVGYDGYALDRLAAIEQIEQSGAEVTLQAPALFPGSVIGVIDQLIYTQDQDPGDRGLGTGGVLVVQFRTTT